MAEIAYKINALHICSRSQKSPYSILPIGYDEDGNDLGWLEISDFKNRWNVMWLPTEDPFVIALDHQVISLGAQFLKNGGTQSDEPWQLKGAWKGIVHSFRVHGKPSIGMVYHPVVNAEYAERIFNEISGCIEHAYDRHCFTPQVEFEEVPLMLVHP